MNKLSKLTKYQQTNRIPTTSKTSTVSRGFTIIELLIVIVIIGILVAITAVSYNGITKSAKESALKSELKQASTEVEVAKAKTGNPPANASSLTTPKNGTLTLSTNTEQNTWCLTITPNSPNNQNIPNFNITSDTNTIQEGGCPSPSIQTITKASCPTTRTQVKDQRDNNSYYIQKLGNDCWMLTNLAYAGGTANGGTNTYNDVINQGDGAKGTNTINGPDNSGSYTYDLAKYYIPPGANPTTDPTEPSTSINGTGQYGYLYNWCAAMGGQNTAACANATTPAPVPTTNICPAGWRLPTGGSGGEFQVMNNTVYAGKTDSDSSIIGAPGLFQRSGYWGNGFGYQGSDGYYWSSAQRSATNAHSLDFSSTAVVYPAYDGYNKYYGYAVRCIAE